MLTAKKRAAWKPACPPRASEGPVPVPPEVVHHGDDERHRRAREMVGAEQLDAEREHGQVDHVAGAADRAELDQLEPVVRLAQYRRARGRARGGASATAASPSSLIGRPYTEVVEHKGGHVHERPLLARRRVHSAEQQHALRVVAVERAVAAAAHVIGPAPVHELEAGVADTSTSPAWGHSSADQRRPSASGYSLLTRPSTRRVGGRPGRPRGSSPHHARRPRRPPGRSGARRARSARATRVSRWTTRSTPSRSRSTSTAPAPAPRGVLVEHVDHR